MTGLATILRGLERDSLLSITRVRRLLKVSNKTLHRWTEQGLMRWNRRSGAQGIRWITVRTLRKCPILTFTHAARLVGLTPGTVSRWARSGKLSVRQVSTHNSRVSLGDLERAARYFKRRRWGAARSRGAGAQGPRSEAPAWWDRIARGRPWP